MKGDWRRNRRKLVHKKRKYKKKDIKCDVQIDADNDKSREKKSCNKLA